MGSREGTELEYYQNGNLKKRTTWRNGVREGRYESYYPNGKLNYLGYMSNNYVHGKVRHYAVNGNLKTESYFFESKEFGNKKTFDTISGELLIVEQVFRGIPFSKNYVKRDSINPYIVYHIEVDTAFFEFKNRIALSSVSISIGRIGKNFELLDTAFNDEVKVDSYRFVRQTNSEITDGQIQMDCRLKDTVVRKDFVFRIFWNDSLKTSR